MTGPARDDVLKRALDVALAIVAIVLTSPAFLLIPIAIKVDDAGPILFRQPRYGRGGKAFTLFKFRTMTPSAGDAIVPVSERDPRVTRVGRILRAAGLDELPQLINILRGEMSFVGPRALAIGERGLVGDIPTAHEEVAGFESRLSVRPGLTGPATIYAPKDAPLEQKLAYDLRYIEERSLAQDIRLIAVSIWISLRGGWDRFSHDDRSRRG